jgi:hypothetical protein
MKKIITLVAFIFSNIALSQFSIDSKSIPTYNGSYIHQTATKKKQDIKDKIQFFLSEKLSPEFIKRVLKPGDYIEFNYEIIIDKSGQVITNKTLVNTTNNYFNSKVIRYLNTLPKFTPAVTKITKEPYPFVFNNDAEFFINDEYKLIPLYRIKILEPYKIETDNEDILSLYDSINTQNDYPKPLDVKAYFSTSETKQITKIKVHSNNIAINNLITDSITQLEVNKPKLFSALHTNKNYALNLLINKTKVNPDKYPVYKGCNEKLNKDKQLKCMSKKINKFINKEFNSNLAANLGLIGRQKILVGFKVNEKGEVFNVMVRAPHPELRKEMLRVIKKLPKMQPAMKNGKPITILFSIPIIFVVD